METPTAPGGSGLSRIPRSTPRPGPEVAAAKNPDFKAPRPPTAKPSTFQPRKVISTPRGITKASSVASLRTPRSSLTKRPVHSSAVSVANGLKRTATAPVDVGAAKRTRVLAESNKANVGTKRADTRAKRAPVKSGAGSSREVGSVVGNSSTQPPDAEKKRKVQPWDIKGKLELAQENNKKLKDDLERAQQQLSELQEKTEALSNASQEKAQVLANLSKENECLQKRVVEKEEIIRDYSQQIEGLQMHKVKLEKTVDDLKSKINDLSHELSEKSDQVIKLNDLRKEMHNQIQDLKGNIRVFCRVRPPTKTEAQKGSVLCNIVYPDTTSLEITKSKDDVTGKSRLNKQDFAFDRVFSASATQTDIYQELEQLVQSSLDGYNVCVLAYGQTGSGKTYTMDGEDDPNHRGMIPRTVETLFTKIEELKTLGWEYTVQCFFIEIYNEQIRDLLNYNSQLPHDIRMVENKKTEVQVTNLSVETAQSAEELYSLLSVARRNRYVAATVCNEHSSRSHFIMKVIISGVNKERGMSCAGSICLVDLAGSERYQDQNLSDRKKETLNINKSLSSLANVILSLQQKQEHIPYRNSKLTHLLMPCLGGTSKTLMIVNIAPVEECYAETLNSLRFATRVNQCHVVAKKYLRST